MVRWSAFITRFMWRYASRRDGRQARTQRSSTARVPRARKKGGRARPAGLRCGQEDQRSQTPHSRRYARPLAERGGACRQNRDGMMLVLDRRTRRLFPFIERIYGDGGYRGPKAAKAAAKTGDWTIEIVERSSTAVGFEVLPKRWIVERTFAWLSRFRRLARDFERYARTVAAFIHLAMIRIMLQRLVASSSS